MTIQQWLDEHTHRLGEAGIETARLDCLVLLEDTLGTDRASLLAHPERKIDQSHLLALSTKITQRLHNTPLAYIREQVNFYGRSFVVSKDVLIPRPESEALIELLKTINLPANVRIGDIGTGTGCLGITAGLELPGSHIFLYDINEATLTVARQNARRHHLSLQATRSDLLTHATVGLQVLLANLPYVPNDFPINAAAQHEPPLALFAGPDGLDLYRRFWDQVGALPQTPQYILTESFPNQHKANSTLARAAGFRLKHTQNFAQLFVR